MASIYPQINLPTLVAPTPESRVQKYYPAPYFDFEKGDFIFDGAGRPIIASGKEAFEQWCLKTCMTERNTRLAYSDKIGGEFERVMKETDPEAVKSSIIRTITETIMVNPATEWVKNFIFFSEGDSLWVTFEVKGREWDEASTITLTT